MIVDGVMYYTAKEVAGSSLFMSFVFALALIGVYEIIKKFFKE